MAHSHRLRWPLAVRPVQLKPLILFYTKVVVKRSSLMADTDSRLRLAWWPTVDTVVDKMDDCCSRWLPDSFECGLVDRRRALARRTRQYWPALVPIVGHSSGLGSSVGRLVMVVGMTECVRTWRGLMRSHRLGCRLVDRMVASWRLSCRSSLLPMKLMLGCRVRHKVIVVEVLAVRKIEQFDDHRLGLLVEEVIRKCHPKILLDSIVDDNG